MNTYRLKPIVVDAIQYTGDLLPAKRFLGIKDARYDQVTREMIIGEEGNTKVIHVGDWITKDIEGVVKIFPNETFTTIFELISK